MTSLWLFFLKEVIIFSLFFISNETFHVMTRSTCSVFLSVHKRFISALLRAPPATNTMWTYDANFGVSADLEPVGFMTYTSASHHGSINMFWLHFEELPCSPSLCTELVGPIGQSDKSPAGVSNEIFSDFLV